MADPNTIQFQTETVGGGSLGAQPATLNAGVVGGQTSAGPVRSGADWFQSVGGMTTEFGGNLPQFLEEAFAPALENTKNKREWEGFTAARAGQQMDEIAETQPWYTKVFGPTNYEMGAQTFHVQKQVSDMEADIVRRMPELRTLSPQAMAEEFNRTTNESMMGNSFADSMLKKMFMERAGPLMDLHTKEREAWQQTEQLRLNVEAGDSALTAYQELYVANSRLGTDSPETPASAAAMIEAEAAMYDVLTSSVYQTDESRYAMYRAVSLNGARNGNFAAVNKLLDAGLMSALSVPQQEELTQQLMAARNQYYANRPIDDASLRDRREVYVEAAQGILSADGAVERSKLVNERNTARTGDRLPLITHNDAEQVSGTALSQLYSSIAAAERQADAAMAAASTEGDKEALRLAKVQRAASSWKEGNIGFLIHGGAATSQDAEQAAMAHYQTNPSEALLAQVNSYAFPNFRWVSKDLAAAVQQGVHASPDLDWTPSFHNSYEQFKLMDTHRPTTGLPGVEDTTSGPNAAREIFGDDNTALFREYEAALAQRMAPEQAYKAAQIKVGNSPINRGDLTKEQAEALQSELKPANAVIRWFTGETPLVYKGALNTNAMREFPKVQRLNPGKSDAWLAQAARKAAEAKNTDVAGEFTWDRREGQKAITAYADQVSPDIYGAALRQYMHSSAKKANVTLDDDSIVLITRQEDRGGFPVLSMFLEDKHGRYANLNFMQQDFEKVQKQSVELAKAKFDAEFEMMKTNPTYLMRGAK